MEDTQIGQECVIAITNILSHLCKQISCNVHFNLSMKLENYPSYELT